MEVLCTDGSRKRFPEAVLDAETSKRIFERRGEVKAIEVFFD